MAASLGCAGGRRGRTAAAPARRAPTPAQEESRRDPHQSSHSHFRRSSGCSPRFRQSPSARFQYARSLVGASSASSRSAVVFRVHRVCDFSVSGALRRPTRPQSALRRCSSILRPPPPPTGDHHQRTWLSPTCSKLFASHWPKVESRCVWSACHSRRVSSLHWETAGSIVEMSITFDQLNRRKPLTSRHTHTGTNLPNRAAKDTSSALATRCWTSPPT